MASSTLTYSFTQVEGLKNMLLGGAGMYLDRFEAASGPGVIVIHGFGNVMERTLADGEAIHIEPGGFLYRDASVTMEVITVNIASSADTSKATDKVRAAKDLAGRGFRGFKAAREMMKGGVAEMASQVLSGSGGATLASAVSSNRSATLLSLTGPGRVGIQSMYLVPFMAA